MTNKLLRQLLIQANQLGLEGKKVIDWIPNDDAGSVWPGAFISVPVSSKNLAKTLRLDDEAKDEEAEELCSCQSNENYDPFCPIHGTQEMPF